MRKKVTENYVRLLFSKNLKRFRTLHNMSQLSLSNRAGLTHNFINDIENCKKGISVKTLAKLSAALNVEPHQFFLADDMQNNMQLYVSDFTDSLQKLVQELAEQYLVPPSRP